MPKSCAPITMIEKGLCLLTCLTCLLSCRHSCELGHSLKESGANRTELEHVLAHYRSVGDRESLQAAEFLIANMHGHYSCESPSLGSFYEAMDSLYPDMSNVVRRVLLQIPLRIGNQEFDKVYDVAVMSSDYLIAHIDRMMEIWRTCRWLSESSFEDFCEYLLPYRFAEGPVCQKLDSTDFWWRDIRQEALEWSNLPLTPTDVRQLLNRRINGADNAYKIDLRIPGNRLYTFDCEDNGHYEASSLRSAGVPVALDFVPEWSTRNGRHYWSVMVDPYYVDANSSNTDNLRAGKVYRHTYSHQPSPRVGAARREEIPVLFQSPFIKDVTSQYTRVADITLPVNMSGCKYVYLAVFNEMQWKPVAWSRHLGPFARFRDVGRNGVYLPVVMKTDGMYAAGRPFIVHADGKRETLCPSGRKTDARTVSRKYPLTYSKVQWGRELLEYSFEAAKDSSFSEIGYACAVTSVSPHLNECRMEIPDSVGPYRYWRIKGRRIHVGELKFLDASQEVMDCRIVVPESARKENSDTYLKAFDGNVLTYTTTPDWIGVDFGFPQTVSAICYVSRTDDNGIVPGHTYELYVFDRGWRSLGRKQAESDSLLFDEVPSGGLYWLHCLDEGREERIFTYDENGHQIWW